MYYVHRALGAVACITMMLSAWFTIAWARADAAFREQSPEGIERAVELAPDHRLYRTAAAIQAEYDGQDAEVILRELAARHPRAAASRLQLGLAAEIRGDIGEAERWLLDAYSVDKMFETRWTLANFYFRQGREDDFWVWIKSALEISYGDRRPAFDLCWRASDDAALILERGIPDRHEVLGAYVWFLLDTKRIDAAGEAADRLAVPSSPEVVAPVHAAIDALLDAGRYGEAARVWERLDLADVAGLTNGSFSRPPLNAGFDWRIVRNAGVNHTPLEAGRGYRVRLSGSQPEQCDLLRQWIGGLQPGRRYALRWDADGAPGVSWRIAGAIAAVEGNGELVFTAPAEATLLTLAYARPVGQVRQEANIDLRRVWLE